ncbi:MAG: dTMP kinase [SAR324 cluster bacterium]|nr:dTMP kinase [SAR324 cluster bacterium]
MFITFEGMDASGKTTQIDLLCESLRSKGVDFILTKEPGGTEIGQKIRKILLDPENAKLCAKSELLLYLADRIQHLEEKIRPALKTGKLVLCDRYHDATVAYQGGGRGLDLSWIESLVEENILKPDLTFFFDISPEVSQARLTKRNEELGMELCRMESEDMAFFERIRVGYKTIAATEPKRVVVIDASKDITTITAEIATHLSKIL